MARVARVVGRNETSLATAVHQCPTLVRLEAMVKLAQTVEEVENGYVGAGPVLAVVRLEESSPRTTLHQYRNVGFHYVGFDRASYQRVSYYLP